MTRNKWTALLLLALLMATFFYFDIGAFLTLERIKSEQAYLVQMAAAYPVQFISGFLLLYIIATTVSLPGAAVLMTLTAGALFGLLWGVVIVSFASTIGATFAMLLARWLFREQIERRFSKQLEIVNRGMAAEGAFYLFTMRLIPAIPFFAINLAMGLTRISLPVYYLVSQAGMLAGTIVYVNAGKELAQISSATDILSPGLIASFVLLGVFPLLAKWLVQGLRRSRAAGQEPSASCNKEPSAFRNREPSAVGSKEPSAVSNKEPSSHTKQTSVTRRPASFDRDLIVIGAGSGGLVAALIAATVNAKVTLIEQNKMGGDCLNTGCVPSKTLIRSARFAFDMKRAADLGFSHCQLPMLDFNAIMQRVQRVISRIEPHDSVERYESLGVDVELGQGELLSPWHVRVKGKHHDQQDEKILSTRQVIIATGSTPFIPPLEGIEQIDCLSSDNLWELRELPARLVILGGGPIGCELAQALARLGACPDNPSDNPSDNRLVNKVTLVELLPRLLPQEDEEFSALVQTRLEAEGVRVLVGHGVTQVIKDDAGQTLVCHDPSGEENRLSFDRLLVATGRKASVDGFGRETLGIRLTDKGEIAVDEYLRTNISNIYAIGDVAGPYQFTHTASYMAWYATVNALFGALKKFRVDYRVIPYATFCSPEIARVGLNEQEARAQGIAYEVTTYDVAGLDRAIVDEAAEGLVKVLTQPGRDKILGVTIAADHAGDLISEFTLAMKYGLGLNKILSTVHVYPTMMEMNKFVASEWRKHHKPEWALALAGRYHAWRRGRNYERRI